MTSVARGNMRVHTDLLALLDSQLPLLKGLHANGSLAPVAAAMDPNGKIKGHAFVAEHGHEEDLSVKNVMDYFSGKFREAFQQDKIVAAAIFFHGRSAGQSVRPALTADQANVLVAWLDHASGQSLQAIIAYVRNFEMSGRETGGWRYGAWTFNSRTNVQW